MVKESILHPIKMYNQNKKQMSSYMYKFYFSYVKFNKNCSPSLSVMIIFTLKVNLVHLKFKRIIIIYIKILIWYHNHETGCNILYCVLYIHLKLLISLNPLFLSGLEFLPFKRIFIWVYPFLVLFQFNPEIQGDWFPTSEFFKELLLMAEGALKIDF